MKRRLHAAAIVGAIVGALLFVWALRAAGAGAVLAAVRRLGIGFAAVVALGGVRHVVRAAAWRLCLDRPGALPLAAAAGAYVAGDAIGNVTPFGILISEPSKIVLVRNRLDLADAIAALAIENLLYGVTVAVMLIAGTIALLAEFEVTSTIRTLSLLIAAAAAGTCVAAVAIARWKPALTRPLAAFSTRHRSRLPAIALLECAYHAAAVVEIWVALRLITGTPPTLLTAFVLEYVNRTITVAFQFVPMWLGVDEAGTGIVTSALGLTAATGVALALARKARIAVWTGAGLVLLGIFRPRRVFTGEEHEGRDRWRERIFGAAAGEGARR